MKLHLTRRHWNRLAETDPLWAVLTSPDKKGQLWQVDEFFADGRKTVDETLPRLRTLHPTLATGQALDFGCGVGRLSQALALHFENVVGLDISEQMLTHARSYNQHGERVRYLHNPHPDLRLFPDGSFDFIFSLITLQHMEPVYAKRYIGEFIRILRPGGAVFFQLPGVRPPEHTENSLLTHWPPTFFKRVRRRLARRLNVWTAKKPVMEMHAIPKTEVLKLLESHGARVIEVANFHAAGELESWAYFAVKP